MVAQPDPNVKSEKKPRVLKDRLLSWVDSHPRVGWYLCFIATMNLLLNLLELFR